MSGLHIYHPTVVLHGQNTALVSDLSGQIAAEELHGFFAGDTRLISTYKFDVNGCTWRLLGRTRTGHGTAQWQFQNPEMRDELGDIAAGCLAFSLRRRVAGALHDDLTITSFAPRPVRLHFILQLDVDFADIFEVKANSIPPRMALLRIIEKDSIIFSHEANRFKRALHVRLRCSDGSEPSYTASRIGFDLVLQHGQKWECCLEAEPEIDGNRLSFVGHPHESECNDRGYSNEVHIECIDPLRSAFERGRSDLHALTLDSHTGFPIVAAGAPWFLTVFGRDALVTSLMSGIDGTWAGESCLSSLAKLQGKSRNDFRDEEPGKIAHELRIDELTRQGKLPYSPYYGTHDAPALYCLTLWHTWRWSGKDNLLKDYFDAAWEALRWCDNYGDLDHDGLQEYMTRSPKGYRNQGWKDSGDAIVDKLGRQRKLPLATVELQGYWYAAKLAMAEICEALGRAQDARELRSSAAVLRQLVEDRFWIEDLGFYALALDGDKQWVDAISSNPAHLLWCGLPSVERATRVARRLLEPDLFSGWGIRTLSASNPAYNPLSYQLGSVWPHDTLIASAGLWRYGFREEASRLIHGILTAAERFDDYRLPELFCGFDSDCGFPVPYEQANIPQAWAAAVPLFAAQLFLGLVPDAPHKRCFVSPWLPDWLPRLQLQGISIGDGVVDITIARNEGRTVVEKQHGENVQIVNSPVSSPLMGDITRHESF